MDVPGPSSKAKNQGGSEMGGPAVRPVRRYPKPPAFIPRFIMLCLRPESWAEAARYPTHVTLVPLIVAILVGALIASAGLTYRQVRSLEAFAATYDRDYPPMELNSEGVLSVKGELKAPVRVPMWGSEVLVDPTGATTPDSPQTTHAVWLITDKKVIPAHGKPGSFMGGYFDRTIAAYAAPPFEFFKLPPKGQVTEIDGATIGALVREKRIPMMAVSGVLIAVMLGAGEAIWSAMILFLATPVIVLAAGARVEGKGRVLILPRRAALRMAAGYLVPLVLAGCILRATGHAVADVLDPNWAVFFWFAAALALAIWTGLLARRMYGPPKK